MMTFPVNGQARQVDVSPDMPLLWLLRETIGPGILIQKRLPIRADELKRA